ncbi:MAG: phosphatase PAP2 family protein [Actinomycetes bacterium]
MSISPTYARPPKLTKKQLLTVWAIFLGIVLAFITYEIFNKAEYSYQPLVMKGWLDAKIPIISLFVIPYLSFHLLAALVVPLLSLRIAGFKAFLVNGLAIIFGQLCLDVAYAFFQTEVPRTPVTGHSPFDWMLVNLVYGNDRPLNGFPSNHVTWSVVSMIALWRLRHLAPRTSWILMAWFTLILPATVFLHQHFLIDIYGGIFVAFTCYWSAMFAIEKPLLRVAP